MAVNRLLDIQLSVPNPAELIEFWERRGMRRTSDGVLGTEGRDVQLQIAEGGYRHLAELHLGCAAERDLADVQDRLGDLGVAATISDTRLTCTDPIFGHRVVLDVTAPNQLTPALPRALNGPGEQNRRNARADVTVEEQPRPPRRLGHIVLGTPHVEAANAFYFDGLGFRISDRILGGVATFGRVEADHHNLLIQPGPTSYINHYALEVDDVDAIGAAGQAILAECDDASVVGIGRHFLGSNVFWYLTDPSGTMFEFFSDMDQITDDDHWDQHHRRDDWAGADGPAPVSIWGPKEPETFFNPADLDVIGEAREALGLD